MDFKQLLYFTTVVDEGTISAAARKLHMTQPPLSTQLKLLEDEVGCLLFERGPRSIRLTDAGRIMYDRAVLLLRMSSQLTDELDACTRGSHGTLRIGIISSVGSTLCCDWFRGFHEKYPDVGFEVSEANTYQLLEKLQDGVLELAIVRSPFPAGDFISLPLKEERIYAAGHKKYFKVFHDLNLAAFSSDCSKLTNSRDADSDFSVRSAFHGTASQNFDSGFSSCEAASYGQHSAAIHFPPISSIPLSIKQLSLLPLILYRRWEPLFSDVFHAAGAELKPICKNDDARTTAFWTDAGLGVGLLPEAVLPLLHNPKTICFPLDGSAFTTNVFLIRSKNAYLSAVGKSFIRYLAETVTSK